MLALSVASSLVFCLAELNLVSMRLGSAVFSGRALLVYIF